MKKVSSDSDISSRKYRSVKRNMSCCEWKLRRIESELAVEMSKLDERYGSGKEIVRPIDWQKNPCYFLHVFSSFIECSSMECGNITPRDQSLNRMFFVSVLKGSVHCGRFLSEFRCACVPQKDVLARKYSWDISQLHSLFELLGHYARRFFGLQNFP